MSETLDIGTGVCGAQTKAGKYGAIEYGSHIITVSRTDANHIGLFTKNHKPIRLGEIIGYLLTTTNIWEKNQRD